jgi:hypothetical protein
VIEGYRETLMANARDPRIFLSHFCAHRTSKEANGVRNVHMVWLPDQGSNLGPAD